MKLNEHAESATVKQIDPNIIDVAKNLVPEITKNWHPKKLFGKILKPIVNFLPFLLGLIKK
jgi:hypothetical protein